MGTVMYYKLSDEALREWYNVVGADEFDYYLIKPEQEARDLYELSPLGNLISYKNAGYEVVIPNGLLSTEIDNEYMQFTEATCHMCGGYASPEAYEYQQAYSKAYLGILKTATNLNLTNPKKPNYLLDYLRLDTIIHIILTIMNNISTEEVIKLYNDIENKDAINILESSKRYGTLSLLVYLGMNPNSDIADYKMFEENKYDKISIKRLKKIINDNAYAKTNYDVTEGSFDLSIIGLFEEKLPNGEILIKARKNNCISEEARKEYYKKYKRPFERLSYRKTMNLMEQSINDQKM